MSDLLRSPWSAQFDALLGQANSSLVLCAPFVGRGPCERVRARLAGVSSSFELTLLTDLSCENILCGATDVVAIADLVRTTPGAAVRFLPSLHAKVYVADEKCAIVTSGNLTDNGLLRNFEYGVLFTEVAEVLTIRRDVLDYASLGSLVDSAQLNVLASAAAELRELRQAAERSIRSSLRREFNRRVQQVDYDLLRVRAAGRTSHSIFADTILHLLRRGPLKTVDIHKGVQRIHPDLCDDRIDRVIDGQHFGKKWKHGVRTAQVYLRRRGDIKLENGKWQINT